jgi:hypothetical protein
VNKKDVRNFLNLEIAKAKDVVGNRYLTEVSHAEAVGYLKALEDVKKRLMENGGKYIHHNHNRN